VVVTYRSRRALCPLAKGIIRGAAAHYQVDVTLSEERCMLRGDPECVIAVSGGEM
jgi:predicted hydrocarbon binding protein